MFGNNAFSPGIDWYQKAGGVFGMLFIGKRMIKINTQSTGFWVVILLSLSIIWSFLSLKIHGTGLNFLELRILLLCQFGLVAIVFLSRFLLFQNIRNPLFFKWAAALFLLVFLGLKISPNIFRIFNRLANPYIQRMASAEKMGTGLISWGEFPFVFLEGLILSLLVAWLAEIVFGVFWNWRRLPRFDPCNSYQYWDHLWLDILKMGLLITLLMILTYFFIINFLLVDTVLYSYLLTVPVLASGAGLFLLLSKKVRGWRESEIREIDARLAPYLAWQKYVVDFETEPKDPGILPWVQYLSIIRDYLRQTRRPYIRWWVVMLYLLFCGIMAGLPNFFRVVVEAY